MEKSDDKSNSFSKEEINEEIRGILRHIVLEHKEDSIPNQISDGELQKVGVERALDTSMSSTSQSLSNAERLIIRSKIALVRHVIFPVLLLGNYIGTYLSVCEVNNRSLNNNHACTNNMASHYRCIIFLS